MRHPVHAKQFSIFLKQYFPGKITVKTHNLSVMLDKKGFLWRHDLSRTSTKLWAQCSLQVAQYSTYVFHVWKTLTLVNGSIVSNVDRQLWTKWSELVWSGSRWRGQEIRVTMLATSSASRAPKAILLDDSSECNADITFGLWIQCRHCIQTNSPRKPLWAWKRQVFARVVKDLKSISKCRDLGVFCIIFDMLLSRERHGFGSWKFQKIPV